MRGGDIETDIWREREKSRDKLIERGELKRGSEMKIQEDREKTHGGTD